MRLRTKLLVLAAALAVMLVVALPASAVKYGKPDGNAHPYVGLIVFYDGATPLWRCTGTLISPTLVLTAAHCAESPATAARIWFDEKVSQVGGYPFGGGDSHTGTPYPSPWWQGGLFLPNTGDVGVVVLDSPVTGKGTLPTMAPDGFLDALATKRGTQNVSFEVVGYGLQSVKPALLSVRDRLQANVQLVNLRSSLTDGYNVHTTNNPGKGTGGGGTCFGDSGGPVFSVDEAGRHLIVGVNSFVLNSNCMGASFAYRVDRTEVQDWVNGPHPAP